MSPATALALAALAAAAAAQAPAAAPAVADSPRPPPRRPASTTPVPEINSGILLVGPPDYRWFGGSYGSRCTQMVDRAAAMKQTRVMITPTLFWVDDDFKVRGRGFRGARDRGNTKPAPSHPRFLRFRTARP